jgi:hypothetical protein
MEQWGQSYEKARKRYEDIHAQWKDFFSRKEPDGTDRFVDIEVEDK